MKSFPISELDPRLVKLIEAGETVLLTRDNKTIASVTPEQVSVDWLEKRRETIRRINAFRESLDPTVGDFDIREAIEEGRE